MPRFKQVATFYNVNEAHIACAYLQSHDINARVPDSHTTSILSYMTPFFGGCRLVVPAQDFDEALRLLRMQNDFKVVELPTEPELKPDERPSPAEDYLRRAFYCAILGLLLILPSVLSSYYLGRYLYLNPRGPRNVHFWAAFFLNLFSLSFFVWFVRAIVLSLRY